MNNKLNPLAVFICLAVVLCIYGEAQASPPLPAKKAVSLEHLETTLEAEKKSKERIEKDLKEAAGSLADTRAELTEIGASVKANETLLSALEGRIDKLAIEEKALSDKLESDYSTIADLVLAMERLRRVPTESLIVRPGAPLQTAQTATLLKSILPALHSRATALSADLDRLSELHRSLTEDRNQALRTKATLEKKYADIAALVKKRERLYKSLNTDYAQTQRVIERITREAQSMQDLMERLERERKRKSTPSGGSAGMPVAAALPAPGHPQLPVSGVVLTQYGEKDGIGAISQGISVEARPSAIALAPMGGIVRFAGPFKNYGGMVIIEHKGQYHSLIGGLENINVMVGQELNAGEPLGKLPLNSSRGGRPALYYELRYKGRPVNPADKLLNLKS